MTLLSAIAICAASPLTGAPAAYQLDAAGSEISAKVSFFGLGSKSATFPKMSGSIWLDPAQPEAINLRVTIDAKALEASDGVTQRRLKGEKFFWVDRYPEVVFTGSRLSMTGPATGVIDGAITARGQTHGAKLDVTFDRPTSNICGQRPVGFTATTAIDRRHYDMRSYGLIVGNTVKIRIEAQMDPGL